MSSEPAQSITHLIVCGAAGRMGSRLCALACEDARFALVGALEARGSGAIGREVCAAASSSPRGACPKITDSAAIFAASSAEVVIDFSSESGVRESAALAKRIRAALLVGTTGLSKEAVEELKSSAREIAVLLAPNTSLGVAALSALVHTAARTLGPSYACSIVEAHHSAKKDAPSGTALRLADAARAGGANVPREQVVSLRGGDVVGEHTVRFAGPGEYIELTHRATSRDLFVRGALVAAAWLKGRTPGWYTMEDVLGMPA